VVLGYQHFDPAVAIRGVVLNFAGSERHAQGCAEAIERATALPVLGWLPRDMQLQIPERHLGLVPGGEQVDSDALIAQMAVAVSARFDVAGVVGVARGAVDAAALAARGVGVGLHTGAPSPDLPIGAAYGGLAAAYGSGTGADRSGALAAHAMDADRSGASPTHMPDTTRDGSSPAGPVDSHCGGPSPTHVSDTRRSVSRPIIAVARDEAFCFYYPENLELLIEEGAAVEFFSPLRGERPDMRAAGVYLGGGYPELHGPALASNTGLWSALKDMHAADVPIYAECGGFMVLTEGLTDSEGHNWPMGGLLPGFARMSGKLAALGYRHATALRSNLLAELGDTLRGHEFRYSSWVRDTNVADDTAAWQLEGTRGDVPNDAVGIARGNLLASYLHVHFGQGRELAKRFVQRLRRAG
jgi:cobyrinic acid a,c-diamide synthase